MVFLLKCCSLVFCFLSPQHLRIPSLYISRKKHELKRWIFIFNPTPARWPVVAPPRRNLKLHRFKKTFTYSHILFHHKHESGLKNSKQKLKIRRSMIQKRTRSLPLLSLVSDPTKLVPIPVWTALSSSYSFTIPTRLGSNLAGSALW